MRYSPQRETILEILRKAKDHPTAEVIQQRAMEKFPKMSLGTVYRNLKQLEESHKISSHVFSGSHHYDGNLEPHHHFFCKDCKKIIDIPINEPVFSEKLIQDFDISVEGVNLSLTGLCSDCKPKTGENPKC